MDTHLFFLKDKILVEGYKYVHISEMDDIRNDILSGLLIVRIVGDEKDKYLVSMNKYYEEEVRKILDISKRNANSRIFKLIDCREPLVVQKLIERVDCQPEPFAWHDSIWMSVLRTGIYYESLESSSMLDSMVFKGRIEYESYGTYCLSTKYMNNLLKKDKIFYSTLEKYLECKNENMINDFMERHGYTREGKKYIKNKVTPIGYTF